ncbi:MAG: hypothetical protein K0S49_30 [Microbacterium sp.]|nr:hypothetical protein [Microbacterium sp.]
MTRCPVCDEPAPMIGVCCDLLIAELGDDDEPAIVRGID